MFNSCKYILDICWTEGAKYASSPSLETLSNPPDWSQYISLNNKLREFGTVQPPEWSPTLKWSPNRPWNDTDPEMIPISLHVDLEMIPN